MKGFQCIGRSLPRFHVYVWRTEESTTIEDTIWYSSVGSSFLLLCYLTKVSYSNPFFFPLLIFSLIILFVLTLVHCTFFIWHHSLHLDLHIYLFIRLWTENKLQTHHLSHTRNLLGTTVPIVEHGGRSEGWGPVPSGPLPSYTRSAHWTRGPS